MKHGKVVSILEGYDDLGPLLALHSRVQDVSGKLHWYLKHIERRIAKITISVMESGKDDVN